MTDVDLPAMLADLESLVCCESFSADHAALGRSADLVDAVGTRLLGRRPERIVRGRVPHLRWSFGTPRVLLLGHHDTVWPTGSLHDHPWSVTDGAARGPGVLDMKAGLVQMFHALAALPSRDGLCVLVTGDEELGSPTSADLVVESVRGVVATFVVEASADPAGAVKTARNGVSRYELSVHGRAAHAGLEPHRGINAAVEMAHQILAVGGLAGAGGPTGSAPGSVTVTPTLVAAGSTANTVPALATVAVDVRAPTRAVQDRIDRLIRRLEPHLPGTRVTVQGGARRPPMEPGASAGLFALAAEISMQLGQGPLTGLAVGGASDGNHTADAGCPTLDGLGGVGGGAHADTEYVEVAQMVPRAVLLAELVARSCTTVPTTHQEES